jgi:hypothetical protein
LWQVLDSNQRRRKPTILQTAPFGHSGNLPYRSVLYPAAARKNTQLQAPGHNDLSNRLGGAATQQWHLSRGTRGLVRRYAALNASIPQHSWPCARKRRSPTSHLACTRTGNFLIPLMKLLRTLVTSPFSSIEARRGINSVNMSRISNRASELPRQAWGLPLPKVR